MASGSDLPTPAINTSSPGPNTGPLGAAAGKGKGQACAKIVTFSESTAVSVSAAISAAAANGDVGGDGVAGVVAVVVDVVVAAAAAGAAAAPFGGGGGGGAAAPFGGGAAAAAAPAAAATATTAACRCSSTPLSSVLSSSLSGRRRVYRIVTMHSGQPPSELAFAGQDGCGGEGLRPAAGSRNGREQTKQPSSGFLCFVFNSKYTRLSSVRTGRGCGLGVKATATRLPGYVI